MRRSTLSVLLFVCLCAGFLACTKSKDTTTPVGTMNAMITANQYEVGSTWSSTSAIATAQYAPFGNLGTTKVLAIGGTKSSGTATNGYVGLILANYKDSADRYVLDNVNNTAVYLTINGGDTTAHLVAYGLVNITAGTDKAAQGVFNFTCTDSIKVSNGVFNVVFR